MSTMRVFVSSDSNSSVDMDKTELLIAKGSFNFLMRLFKLNGSLKCVKHVMQAMVLNTQPLLGQN